MITIVDYGMGNTGSVANMLRRLGVRPVIAADANGVSMATRMILPGVGAFDGAMEQIERRQLRDALEKKALAERIPTLGICLGMQLLTSSSEEGRRPGLGWIRAATRRLPHAPGLRIPHMGWNRVQRCRPHPLVDHLPDDARFYFVHSFAVATEDRADCLLTCRHGIDFDAAIGRGNILGVQFHPEKSHRFGMALLKAFLELPC